MHNRLAFLKKRGPIHAEPSYRGDMPNAIVYDENPNGKGMRFQVCVTILETDGTIGQSDTEVSVQKAKEALIAVAVSTSYNGFDKEPGREGKDPAKLNNTYLQKVKNRSYEDLQTTHIQDFRSFFDRVTLFLSKDSRKGTPTDRRLIEYKEGRDDPDLESLYFQFGRYLLISSSRPGGIPANLQGIWNPFLRPPCPMPGAEAELLD